VSARPSSASAESALVSRAAGCAALVSRGVKVVVGDDLDDVYAIEVRENTGGELRPPTESKTIRVHLILHNHRNRRRSLRHTNCRTTNCYRNSRTMTRTMTHNSTVVRPPRAETAFA